MGKTFTLSVLTLNCSTSTKGNTSKPNSTPGIVGLPSLKFSLNAEDRISDWLTYRGILPGEPSAKQENYYQTARQNVNKLHRSARQRKDEDEEVSDNSCKSSNTREYIPGKTTPEFRPKLDLSGLIKNNGEQDSVSITPGSRTSTTTATTSFSSLLQRRAAKKTTSVQLETAPLTCTH